MKRTQKRNTRTRKGGHGQQKNSDWLYDKVTDSIVAALEKGVVPWHKPWNAAADAPRSLYGNTYRGVNQFVLDATRSCKGYRTNLWGTMRAVNKAGGRVNSGEPATWVVFWKVLKRRLPKLDDAGQPELDESGDRIWTERPCFFLRGFKVWNVDQTTGIELEDLPPIEEQTERPDAQQIVDTMRQAPQIRHGGNKAMYRPALDCVQVPEPRFFDSEDHYWSVLFHELGHSTGHESRIGREGIMDFDSFGTHKYGREELIAEMTASFCCAACGIDGTQDTSAAYLQNWIDTIKGDRKLLVVAAGAAKKAADFILGDKAPGAAADNDKDSAAVAA